MRPPAYLLFAVICAACAPAAPPPVMHEAIPAAIAGAEIRPLSVPSRIGVVRVAGGQVTAIPAHERVRWRGAIREVNRRLPGPIRLRPMSPSGAAHDLPQEIDFQLERSFRSGVNAVLVYELSVRPENDPIAAGFSALPLFGGIVPGTMTTDAQAEGVVFLIDTSSRAVMGLSQARLEGAPVGTLRDSGGRADALRPMAEYAMLHALIPGAEDMLIEAVAEAH